MCHFEDGHVCVHPVVPTLILLGNSFLGFRNCWVFAIRTGADVSIKAWKLDYAGLAIIVLADPNFVEADPSCTMFLV